MVGLTKRKVKENKKLMENLQEEGTKKTGPLMNKVEEKLTKQLYNAYYLDEQWRQSLWMTSYVMIAVMVYKLFESYKIMKASHGSIDYTFINSNQFDFLNIIIGFYAVRFIGRNQSSIYKQTKFYFGMGVVLLEFFLFLSSLYSLFQQYQTIVKNNELQGFEKGLKEETEAWKEVLHYIKNQFPLGGFYYLFLILCDQVMKVIINNAKEGIRKSRDLESKLHN